MIDFNSTINVLKNIFTVENVTDGIRGFSRSNQINLIHDYTEAMEQGASPNSLMVRMGEFQSTSVAGTNLSTLIAKLNWYKTSWLVTPLFLLIPMITLGWPRAHANNARFNQIKDFTQNAGNTLKNPNNPWYFRMLGQLSSGFSWFLNHLPFIHNRFIIRFFNTINRYILSITFLITLATYATMYFYGAPITAIVGTTTLAFGLLDRYNLMPLFLRNFVKKWGLDVCIFAGLLIGNPIEIAVSCLVLPIIYGHHFKGIFTYLLSKFNRTRGFATYLSDEMKQIKKFDFHCDANQFEQSLNEMNAMKSHIIRAHVKDNTILMPPSLPKVNLNDLLKLFDKINWKKDQELVVDINKQHDWRLMRESNNANKNYDNDIKYLRDNLVKFIKRVNTGDIHSVRYGAEDLLMRYTQSIVNSLNELYKKSNDSKLSKNERDKHKSTLIDTLVRLGYETGGYCGIGLLRAAETNYRSLFADSQRTISLKERVRFIHQMNREFFFQSRYTQYQLNLMDNVDDTHAYGRSVFYFAPNLGLPAQFAENDEVNDVIFPIVRDFLSYLSPIENQFWNAHISVQRLKNEIQNALNTPLLPLADIHTWYHHFIDSHVNGSEEELDDLKEELPYTVEMHGTVPIYRLKDNILNLMLLDFDIIALPQREKQSENAFRTASTIQNKQQNLLNSKQKTHVVQLSTHQSKNRRASNNNAHSPVKRVRPR